MSARRTSQPIRVLVVEDSRAQRELLMGLIQATAGFELAGAVGNGQEAIAATQQLRPDVVAMDINLPLVDGFEATRVIMQRCPTPVVMVSSAAGDDQRSLDALAVGALAVVRKPRSLLLESSAADRTTLLSTLRLMAGVRVVTRHPPRTVAPAPLPDAPTPQLRPRVLALAASTGGPGALQTVLTNLGAQPGLPILVAQHIARGFVEPLVKWLQAVVPQQVQLATAEERLLPNHVYLAPDDHHLLLGATGVLALRPGTPGDRYCPSADLLLHSVAEVYGMRAVGVVLTGMGDDGAAGLRALRAAGGVTLAQDEASSVVYGMPRAAVALGAAQQSLSLPEIAAAVRRLGGSQ